MKIKDRACMKLKREASGPKYPQFQAALAQGDSMDELMQNLNEAIEGCLSIEVAPPEPGGDRTHAGIACMKSSVRVSDFARIIVERRGWTLLRINGSHHIYGKSGSVVRLSIPIHGNKPLKLGLLRHSGEARQEISDEDL